ncbi:hypothetical protein B0H10DRAFT_632775 [Mycena sp. CBHHK59/15]|nr:hypothetical protein B0H10DRAFT_632775 [Mycena sp. CBHHK59/15]
MSLVPPAAYADLWPRLYLWITFVHMYWDVIPAQFKALNPEQTYKVYSDIILALERHRGTSDVVRTSPGLRLILAKYWATILPNDESVVAQPDLWHEMCPILIFLGVDASSTKNFEEILDGVGGSQHEFAYLLVKQIRIAVVRPLSDVTAATLSAALKLLDAMSDGEGPFNEALLFHGITKALVTAVSVLDTYPRRQHVAPATHMALMLLIDRFQQRSGHQWITQALDSGLLSVIVSLGLTAKETTTYNIGISYPLLQELLQKVLPGSLVYYPTACQMNKSFPDVLPLAATTAFTRSPYSRYGQISRNWCSNV